MLRIFFSYFSCVLFLFSHHSSSEESLEEIIITSSRVQMPLREVGTSMSVISLEDLERRLTNFLPDLLRSETSITVNNTGGAGKATTVSIRGEEGYRTLVRLDGINISDTSSPQISPRMGQLLTAGVERIEILRGPQGLLYGADAGGVINIATAAAKSGLNGSIAMETGKYGTNQKAISVSGGNGKGEFVVTGAKIQTHGINAKTSDIAFNDQDGYQNETIHAKIAGNISQNLRLSAVLHDVEAENQYDTCYTAFFTISNDCDDSFAQQAWRISAEYGHGDFNHEISFNKSEIDRIFYTESVPGFSPEGSLEQYGYLGSYSPKNNSRFIYGAERKQESMDDGGFSTKRNQSGYFFEYQHRHDNRLFLTGGIRHDDNDHFGSHSSVRFSGAYLINFDSGELKLKAAIGTGFRPPSLFEIAYNSREGVYPPASTTDLKEEKSRGFDLGMKWISREGYHLEIIYFDQTIEDEIFFDNLFWSGYLQEKGESDSKGTEVDFGVRIVSNLYLTANYTHNTTTTSSGDIRALRPKNLGNINIAWTGFRQKLSLNVNYRYAGDSRGPYGASVDSYHLIDITSVFALKNNFKLYAKIENVTDEIYSAVPGYNMPRAAGYVGFQFNFN